MLLLLLLNISFLRIITVAPLVFAIPHDCPAAQLEPSLANGLFYGWLVFPCYSRAILSLPIQCSAPGALREGSLYHFHKPMSPEHSLLKHVVDLNLT